MSAVTGVECPRCGDGFDSVQGLYSHWGYKHEGPTPEDITRPDSQIQKLKQSQEGYTASEEERRKNSQTTSEQWSGGVYEDRDEESKAEAMEEWWSSRSEEWLDEFSSRQSELMKGQYERGEQQPGGCNIQEVEETGHVVRSSAEKEVDLLLHRKGVSYEYEPVFSFDDFSYRPDFQVGDVVIEVKGWPVTDRCIERAERFLHRQDETYVVLALTEQAEQIRSDATVNTMRQVESLIDMAQTNSFPTNPQSKVVS